MDIPNGRKDFNETWLFESPEGIPKYELSETIASIIKDKVNAPDVDVIQLNNGLHKIEGQQLVYYWYEDHLDNILLGAEFEKRPQALKVGLIGKYNKGKPPYASDLYDAVLADRNNIPGNITCCC